MKVLPRGLTPRRKEVTESHILEEKSTVFTDHKELFDTTTH